MITLGERMKQYYEEIPKIKLMRRVPVAIRLDGKTFHTFTCGFKRPHDEVLSSSMQETMKHLCKNIQGCVFGYAQSDEITLILIDYKKLNSSAWFDYEVQKICSVAASMATMCFNKFFAKGIEIYQAEWRSSLTPQNVEIQKKHKEYVNTLKRASDKGAMFDARCFNIPKEEVTNLIYWRQLDAIRNSTQMVGQANYSHKRLQGKSCEQIKNMLLKEKSIVWDRVPNYQKVGSACFKNENGDWIIDKDMPILKDENRNYVDRLIFVGE